MEAMMTTRNTPFAPGTPCWVDLMTSDPDRARSFYCELFGWQCTEPSDDFGGYLNFLSDGHKVAGLVGGGHEHDVWNTYLSTADLDASVTAATQAGGQLLVPTAQVGALGSMAVLQDPTGAVYGLWQPGEHTGFQKYNEAGSVTWDEVLTSDYQACSQFYASTCGWELVTASDTDDFRYTLGQLDGETVAGIMDAKAMLPPGVPSHWAVYFSVANVDETCRRLTELGGSVDRPAEDTSFGRMAEASDPTGARFKLHQALA
jgi:hypothetical protein